MPDPLNPIENESPLGNQDPLDDPILNALEKSIENPPGFNDPLIDDESLMDDLARQLGALEANIESTPSVPHISSPPSSEESIDKNESEVQGNETITSEVLPISDDCGSTNATEHSLDQFNRSPSHSQKSHFLRKNSGRSGNKKGSPSSRRMRGKTGLAFKRQATRYCPEIHEVIAIDGCTGCNKYRHWPQGTDEEPKECWYDWREQSLNDN